MNMWDRLCDAAFSTYGSRDAVALSPPGVLWNNISCKCTSGIGYILQATLGEQIPAIPAMIPAMVCHSNGCVHTVHESLACLHVGSVTPKRFTRVCAFAIFSSYGPYSDDDGPPAPGLASVPSYKTSVQTLADDEGKTTSMW